MHSFEPATIEFTVPNDSLSNKTFLALFELSTMSRLKPRLQVPLNYDKDNNSDHSSLSF